MLHTDPFTLFFLSVFSFFCFLLKFFLLHFICALNYFKMLSVLANIDTKSVKDWKLKESSKHCCWFTRLTFKMIHGAHFNFFIPTYKISKDKILLKEKNPHKRSFIQMEMTDVHRKVFHIKKLYYFYSALVLLHIFMYLEKLRKKKEIKKRFMDISVRCYAMSLPYRSLNVLFIATERKSIINT